MKILFIIILIIVFLIIKYKSYEKQKRNPSKYNFIERFKNRFQNKSRLREKLSEKFSDSLMSDPEINISIGPWYSEIELREKADIHRARLNKYGQSKMNGEMLFLGPKGGVYKYNSEGKKKYL